jgi:adenylate cyclase
MAQEIERKFLITSNEYKKSAFSKSHIMQGYLSSIPERTVRIRIKDDSAYITIKGIGNTAGTSRYEWEKEIPVKDAKELLSICEPGIIDKTRYEIRAGRHIIELDEFHGENEGLIIAEIELKKQEEAIDKPSWLGKEITGEEKYYNAMLMKHPFTKW